MTFDELEKTLPNGLHDAELVRLAVDFDAHELVLHVNLDFSDSSHEGGCEKQTYRAGRMIFAGLELLTIDPPDVKVAHFGVSVIDGGSGQPKTAPVTTPKLSEESFLCWIFVTESNCFIRIAARSVSIEWQP